MPRQPTLISRQASFCAGRILSCPSFNQSQNREFYGRDALPHGAEFVLDVAYSGRPDSVDGMIVNLSDLKPILARAIAPLENGFLEMGVWPFETQVPTLENIARFLWENLPNQVGGGQIARLILAQGSVARAVFTPQKMLLSRRYEFAAAHRLHTSALSPEENFGRFNKCSNQNGHGHNYGLEVAVAGTPDEKTGVVIAPALLDKIVDEEVFARFDHKFLNLDCPEFSGVVPTSENFAQIIFDLLEKRLQGEGFTLAKIGLHETQKNYFEVSA